MRLTARAARGVQAAQRWRWMRMARPYCRRTLRTAGPHPHRSACHPRAHAVWDSHSMHGCCSSHGECQSGHPRSRGEIRVCHVKSDVIRDSDRHSDLLNVLCTTAAPSSLPNPAPPLRLPPPPMHWDTDRVMCHHWVRLTEKLKASMSVRCDFNSVLPRDVCVKHKVAHSKLFEQSWHPGVPMSCFHHATESSPG